MTLALQIIVPATVYAVLSGIVFGSALLAQRVAKGFLIRTFLACGASFFLWLIFSYVTVLVSRVSGNLDDHIVWDLKQFVPVLSLAAAANALVWLARNAKGVPAQNGG